MSELDARVFAWFARYANVATAVTFVLTLARCFEVPHAPPYWVALVPVLISIGGPFLYVLLRLAWIAWDTWRT